jgi:hypothetical protein
MKKITLLIAFFLAFVVGHGQTAIQYGFSAQTGTYTELASPTVLGTATGPSGAASLDDLNYNIPFPSGFAFTYLGTAQTSLNVNTNGYVGFGTAPWTTNPYTPLSSNPSGGTTSGVISAFGADLNAYSSTTSAPGSLSWKVEGTGTDQVLVIQYKNFKRFENSDTVDRLVNFQIRLYASTHASKANYIEFVYGNSAVADTQATSFHVGIRGAATTWDTGVNNLMLENNPAGSTCSWLNAVTGSSNAVGVFLGTTNSAITIPNGLTYAYFPQRNTPPNPVRVFATTTVTSSTATVSWTAVATATSYNVQYRALTTTGCTWTNWTGNPVTNPTVTLTGLSESTAYQVRVQATAGSENAIWSHAVTFTTLSNCVQPTAVAISNIGSDVATLGFTASVTPPALGYDYYVSTSSTVPVATTTPTGNATGTSIPLTALAPTTQYYVWVRSKCSATANSVWTAVVSFTTTQVLATLPFIEDFERATPSFALVNGTQPNKWVYGTATSNGTSSTRSLYISNDNGVSNAYTITSATSRVHAYRDIAFPAGTTQAILSFDFKNTGEDGFDYVRVWAVPTTFIPVAGTAIDAATNGPVLIGNLNIVTAYTRISYIVSPTTGQNLRLVFEWRNDGTEGANPPAAIDNISVIAVTCYAPTAITKVTVPGTSTISWTAPATVPASYDYYYSTANTAPTAATAPTGNTTSTSVALTTLTSDTVYYVWVRSNCGGTDTSVWVNGGSFRTECLPTVPSSTVETFTTYDGTASSPACWKEANGTLATAAAPLTLANSLWTNENFGNATGPNGLAARVELYGTRNAWIVSPAIDLGNGTLPYQLEYTTVVTPWTGTTAVTAMGEKYVKVVVSRDGGATWSDANVLRTYDNTNIPATSRTETIQLVGYTGVVRIGFYAYSTSTAIDLRFYIDNFRVRATPDCLNPVTPVAGTIGENTIQFSWTAPTTAPENGYQYYVSTANTVPTATTTPTGSVGAGILTATAGTLLPATQYYIWVRSNCDDAQSEWVGPVNVRTLCDAPDGVTATGGTICGQGSATLNATATSGTISWYAAATGGNALATGASFATPQITETTTYYVSAGNVSAPASGGAKVTPTGVDTITPSSYGLVFNALSAFTLNSVDVFLTSATAGNVVVVLQNSAGTQLQTTTVAVPAGNATTPVQFTLPLGWEIPQGTGYRILAVSGPSMVREFAATVAYPYAVGGSANVTSGYNFGTSTSYFFFYNWNYTAVCSTARVAVVATVTAAPAITAAVTDNSICNGESTTLSVTSANAGYTYVWTPGNLTGSSQTVTPTATTTYTVTGTDVVSGCVAVSTVVVTVNALPNAIAITPASAEVCANVTQALTVTGASVSGAATLGTGTNVSGTTAYPNPFSAFYGGTKTQILFREDELLAQGLVVGAPINSLSFDFAAAVANANTDLRIKMGTTTLQELTAGIVPSTNLATVYNANYTPVAGRTGLVPFALTTPYVWNGGNLVVEVAHNAGNGGNGSGTTTRNTTTTFNSVYTQAKDNVEPAGTASFDTATAYSIAATSTARPNVVFNYAYSNAVTWSPATGLFTDAAATIPYTAGTAATTVYANLSQTTTYTAIATSNAGCTVTTTATIGVTVIPAPVAAATQTFCSQGTIGGLVATGTAIQWFANATGGTALANDVALVNGTVYYASQTVNGCVSVSRIPVTATLTTVVVDSPADVVTCTSYALPALTNGSYYTAANGGGTAVAAGTPVTQTTTFFVYATAGTNPVCSAQSTFTVTINNATADDLQDVNVCDSYVLPALTNGAYYTQTGGTGTLLTAGTPVTQSGTIYIYAQSNTVPNCTSETSFVVTVADVNAPTGVSPQSIAVNTAAEATVSAIAVTATGTVTWYPTQADAIAGTNALVAGTLLTEGATYYATQTVGTCTSTDVLAVTIQEILGGKGFDVSSFSYYPNPVNNVLNLSYSSEITSVAVFNLVGQQVLAQQPKATTAKLDTTTLAEGTYIVRVTAGNAVKTIKVIKKGN